MKKLFLGLSVVALSASAYSASAKAETQVGDFTFSGNAGIVTDYVYRGISQTDEGPAVQGGFDVGHSSGLYAGIWGSNVDFNDEDEAYDENEYNLGYSG